MPHKYQSTVFQREKKNKSRLSAKERGQFPSTQKSSYKKPIVENPNQPSLL